MSLALVKFHMIFDTYFFFQRRHNTTVVIKLCAEKAHSLGFVYFALQFYGECWAGDSDTADTFYLNGNSHKCDNGVAGEAANFVYKIGSPAGMVHYN